MFPIIRRDAQQQVLLFRSHGLGGGPFGGVTDVAHLLEGPDQVAFPVEFTISSGRTSAKKNVGNQVKSCLETQKKKPGPKQLVSCFDPDFFF